MWDDALCEMLCFCLKWMLWFYEMIYGNVLWKGFYKTSLSLLDLRFKVLSSKIWRQGQVRGMEGKSLPSEKLAAVLSFSLSCIVYYVWNACC